MTTPHALMAHLFSYIEQVEKLNHKPAYTLPSDGVLGSQRDIEALPGVSLGAGDSWLRLSRLVKTAPPALPPLLLGWCALSDDPKKAPELLERKTAPGADGEPAVELSSELPQVRALFEAYQRELWRPWAQDEIQTRASIRLYQKLFHLHQSLSNDASEQPLELVWGCGVASWMVEGKKILHPLITQACEIALNPDDFSIDIRPRDAEPRLELDCHADCQNPGVKSLEARWAEFLSAAEAGSHALTPFATPGFSGALATAAAELSATGVYEPERTEPPMPGPQLVVSGAWVLFSRERSGHFLLKDVERLKEAAQAQQARGEPLPLALGAFVTPGKDELSERSRARFRGLSSGSGDTGAQELFFPLPYNEEQVAIIRELEANAGVVVMGPPGTGKTHTIANVICHYLAQGKKVLVTSKGETALSVLREKIPEQARRLCVSLLTDERDGLRQFEQSVSTITTEVAALDPVAAEQEIALLCGRLDEEHSAIAEIDRQISAFAERHLSAHERDGKPELLADIAKALAAEPGALWIEHGAQPGDPVFIDPEELRQAGAARLAAKASLRSLRERLIRPQELPSAPFIGALARDLQERQALLALLPKGGLLAREPGLASPEEADLLELCSIAARGFETLREAAGSDPWLSGFERRSRLDQLPSSAKGLIARAQELEARRQAQLIHAVFIPEGAERSEDYLEAIERLAQGQKAFGLISFGKDQAKSMLANTRVGEDPARSPEEWGSVRERLRFLKEAKALASQWSALSEEAGWPESAERSADKAVKQIARWARLAKSAQEHSAHIRAAAAMACQLFPELAGQAPAESFFASIRDRLAAGARLARLQARADERSALLSSLAQARGPASLALMDLAQSLGEADPSAAESLWGEGLAELARVESLQESFAIIERAASSAERSGAPAWARRLRSEPALGEDDPLTQASWRQAWDWRAWDNALASLDDPQALARLFQERSDAEARLAGVYERLVVKKTWLGAQKNCTEAIRQKLQQYLNAVQAMGKGTGVRAQRHRAAAREAMKEAYKAVSCWIMPQWRVSEAMAPEMGMFDLVVIDEASQSDIWALPALARGKKILVVGDPKQVSPSAIGVSEEKIAELSSRFLKDQPYKAEMTPDKSIYSLASVVFAGNSVMLKEHFRSAPAIIEYSNRSFYHGQIQPLRSAKPGRELNPPLVDVFVPGGFRKGDANPPEARAIVNEIKAILRDPACEGKSIGVVTLLGQEQAALITRMVHEEIEPSDILSRKISVGAPPVFQGKERDIILLSMVLRPGDRSAADKLETEQRFNVAMSRARDRVYLFRSVEESAFSADSLSAKLIRHFRQPFAIAPSAANPRELCESDFEREFYDLLTERGYRVRPQFPCCGFRIDFVVEGDNGQRLAIECDGDRYHGPGQWLSDMARQRVLERAGWTFWRCFASSFARRPLEVKSDLFKALEAQGVRPCLDPSQAPSPLTERRQAAPFSAASQEPA